MEQQHRDYLNAVAVGIGPGAPAFEHIAKQDMLVVCAWCYTIRTQEGQWIPIAHYLPTGVIPWVTHGICEACKARVLSPDG